MIYILANTLLVLIAIFTKVEWLRITIILCLLFEVVTLKAVETAQTEIIKEALKHLEKMTKNTQKLLDRDQKWSNYFKHLNDIVNPIVSEVKKRNADTKGNLKIVPDKSSQH